MMYIWKEWKEQSRGKGLWLALGIVLLLSLFIFLETRTLPLENSFQVLLLSLYEMNVYIIPLLCLFLASFSVLQEKELKTLMIITTKKENYRSFLIKKGFAIHSVIAGTIIGMYVLLAVPMKVFYLFTLPHFFSFIGTMLVFIVIFNQIGLLLGTVCQTKMQLVGANIFTWFLFVFLIDLIFLYYLPAVSYENIMSFSILFFLDPLHTLPFHLQSSLGVLSLEHMSRLMEKLVWMSPSKFLFVDLFVWTVIPFELAVFVGARRGQR
ncbi:copper ABC transporter permease [Bacillus tianshenii]|nr:copper ABC transporter permease [Bacillus tianshenii]